MDPAVKKLFLDNLDNLDELTAAQQATILAAVEAYDFASNKEGTSWKDAVLERFRAGDWTDPGAAALVMGTVQLKACA